VNASEVGPTTGSFSVVRSGGELTQPLTVNFSTGGTAQSRVNYQPLATSVTIPAGSTAANVLVTPILDGKFTGPLTLNLTLASSSSYQLGTPSATTMSIGDLDRPKISLVGSAPLTGGGSIPATLQISVAATPGIAYLLQSSTDLVTWTITLTNQVGAPLGFVSPANAGATNCFYRVLYATDLSAAGIASALANHYFSANAVGLVNLSLPPGLSLIANPLNTATNTLNALLSGVPNGSQFYKYVTGVGYTISTFRSGPGVWSGTGGEVSLNPGEGGFFKNTTPTNLVLGFVGEVPQGTLANALPAGYSIRSSMVPQAGPLDTLLGFPGAEGDVVYRWINGGWITSTYRAATGWSGITAPALNLSEAIFISKAAATTWTRSFSTTN
jgi:hypothetical protein